MFPKFIAVLMALFVCGCAHSPTGIAIKAWASDYSEAKPMIASPKLGYRLVGGSPEGNQCYLGDESLINTSDSQRTVHVRYDGDSRGTFSADWGVLAKIIGEGKIWADVTLRQIQVTELAGMYMDPGSVCARNHRNEYRGGVTENIIIRAAKSETIDAAWGRGIRVDIDAAQVGGAWKSSSTAGGTWDGAHLYFAHLVQPYKTTLDDSRNEIANGSNAPGLRGCAVRVTGMNDLVWSGTLNCEGDSGKGKDFEIAYGAWKTFRLNPGVSFGVSGDRSRAGFVNVDLTYWATENLQTN